MPKQNNYNVGIYVRLSKDDERLGESISVGNQKLILEKYVMEQGWRTYDIYVDYGKLDDRSSKNAEAFV